MSIAIKVISIIVVSSTPIICNLLFFPSVSLSSVWYISYLDQRGWRMEATIKQCYWNNNPLPRWYLDGKVKFHHEGEDWTYLQEHWCSEFSQHKLRGSTIVASIKKNEWRVVWVCCGVWRVVSCSILSQDVVHCSLTTPCAAMRSWSNSLYADQKGNF